MNPCPACGRPDPIAPGAHYTMRSRWSCVHCRAAVRPSRARLAAFHVLRDFTILACLIAAFYAAGAVADGRYGLILLPVFIVVFVGGATLAYLKMERWFKKLERA